MPFSIHPFHRLPLTSYLGLWLLITLLVLSSGPAFAEWASLFRNDDTGETIYVDKDTIRHKEDVVTWWELEDFKTVQTVGGIRFLSAKLQWEFECAEERMRMLALTEFSGNMGKGDVVLNESPDQIWRPVEPDSFGFKLWKAACAKE